MSSSLVVDLFAEDRAHEEWLRPLLSRIARENGKEVRLRIRSARGGHGRAIEELRTYQLACQRRITSSIPDLLVVAVDANCKSYNEAQQEVARALDPDFQQLTIKATPDPHIERWYLADLESFDRVVGITPRVPANKCERDYYKNVLANAITAAGHPSTLGGIEFARELVDALDYFRAGKTDSSLKHFLEELHTRLVP